MAANLFPLLVQQRCLRNNLVLKRVQVSGSALRHAVGHMPPLAATCVQCTHRPRTVIISSPSWWAVVVCVDTCDPCAYHSLQSPLPCVCTLNSFLPDATRTSHSAAAAAVGCLCFLLTTHVPPLPHGAGLLTKCFNPIVTCMMFQAGGFARMLVVSCPLFSVTEHSVSEELQYVTHTVASPRSQPPRAVSCGHNATHQPTNSN